MSVRSLLLAGLAMLAAAPAHAQGGFGAYGAFDGAWAIDVRTAEGPCGSGFAGEYRISGGRIAGRFTRAGRAEEVTGEVGPDGSFLMRIGGDSGIVLTGRLQWRVGWGEWESPGCWGSFMTNRR
ncbi:MAG: hypothetical protein MUC89_16135 [Acetobacteraceae bacterium]|nr:hypothetical protein [Acetobacteraceae bacterium]